MKKIFFLLFTTITLSQNFDESFLDGTIMFKLNYFIEADENNNKKINDGIGLIDDIRNYPFIEEIFSDINVLRLERPSYHTNKRELQKIYRIVFTEHDKIDILIEMLNDNNNIEFAEKEPIYKNTFIPNDTNHFGTNKWYHTLVNSEDAWDISLGNESVKIAVIDNAIATSHSDLDVFKKRDVADDDNDTTPPETYNINSSWSHGTITAGLATAEINNSTGIASIGGNVELIAVKATGDGQNPGFTYYSYKGVQWACENGANVVSMSYGGGGDPSAALQTLINLYPEVIFLAAAGNDNSSEINYPAGYQNVIGVGSVDVSDNKSSFSNYNDGFPFWVDIAAPGGFSFGGLLSTVYTSDQNSYATAAGTSMATPLAAGLVGLMLSVNPSLSSSDILNCLTTTGVNINQNIGPRIDAYAAMLCALPESNNAIPAFTASPRTTYENDPVIFSNLSQSSDTWSWTFEGGVPNEFEGEFPPEIIYPSIGAYDVSLNVTGSQGGEVLTKENYIIVFAEPTGQWILQNTGYQTASRGVLHISIADENTVWATAYDGSGSGQNVQQFTRTNNGGENWLPGNIDIGNPTLGISMIHAFDYDTAWLVAYPRSGNNIGGIFKTSDGGVSWTRQDSAGYDSSSSFANVVYFWDQNIGFAQGDPINGEYELYVTSDGGSNWTQVSGDAIPNPLTGEYGYVRQIEVVGDNVWYTTNMGRIYHSMDRGNNWVVYNTPISDFGGIGFSFSDSDNGVIVDNNGRLYKTTNSGASWSVASVQGNNGSYPFTTLHTLGLCYIEGTDIVFTTGGSGSSFSNNGGNYFNPIDEIQHTSVEFYNENIGWSGGFNQDSTTGGIWKWQDNMLNNNDDVLQDNFSLSYFPNPVENTLYLNHFNDLTTTVYDITGKELFKTTKKSIDFSELVKGIYILRVDENESANVKFFKILKK